MGKANKTHPIEEHDEESEKSESNTKDLNGGGRQSKKKCWELLP